MIRNSTAPIAGSARNLALPFLALLLLGCFLAPTAQAAVYHPFIGSFGPKGVGQSGNFYFNSPGQVLVDPGSHDVYVLANSKKTSEANFFRFTENGEPDPFIAGPGAGTNKMYLPALDLAMAPPGAPAGTAGDIYAVVEGGVKVYSSEGVLLGTIDGAGNPHSGSRKSQSVDVDSAGNVYILYPSEPPEYPDSHVDKYVPSANPLSNSDFDSQLSVEDLALEALHLAPSAFYALDNVPALPHRRLRYPLAFPGGGGSATVSPENIMPTSNVTDGVFTTNVSNGDQYEQHIYDDGRRGVRGIRQFDDAGNLTSFINPIGDEHGSKMDLDPNTGRIYIPVKDFFEREEKEGSASDIQKGTIDIYGAGQPLESPAAAIDPVVDFDYKSAHFTGTVNPGGSGQFQEIAYYFACRPSEACPIQPGVETQVSIPGDDTDHAVSGDVTGLKPETTYEVELIARNVLFPAQFAFLSPLPLPSIIGRSTTTFETAPSEEAAAPKVTIVPVAGIGGSTATFSGTVNPNAPEAAPTSAENEDKYRTTWYFECVPSCDGGGGELAADNSAHEVVQQALDLAPGTAYTVKLVAENSGGLETAETTFETSKAPPSVRYMESAPASLVTDAGARMTGLIDLNNSGDLTDCQFEYGPTDSYGSTVPCEFQQAEGDDVFVAADATGLDPDTAYRFRLVASNSTGPATGSDNHFRTLLAAGESNSSCPNKAVRVEQKATFLPDCRAWEMVSPPDKNGGGIHFESWNVPMSADGNTVAFQSHGSFGDTNGAGVVGLTQYISRRGADGWGEALGITPLSPPNQFPVFEGNSLVSFMSEDLSHAIVVGPDLPQVGDDTPEAMNDYWLDTRTRALSTITRSLADTPEPKEFGTNDDNGAGVTGGSSADQKVIAFKAETRLLPEAPSDVTSVYEWEEGTLRLASILPDGSPAVAGATIPPTGEMPGTVSRDGSLVTFAAAKEGQQQLYVRRNHTDTVWVSEPEGSAAVTAPADVWLQYITPDSRHILFRTNSQLLDEDTNSLADLYMYTDGPDPDSEQNLTLISSGQKTGSLIPGIAMGGNDGTTSSVMGTSDDASYIYYLSPVSSSTNELWLWKRGMRQVVVAPQPGFGVGTGVNSLPSVTQVSHDGTRLVTMFTPSNLAGRGLSGRATANSRQMYVYDDEREMLLCASCRQTTLGSGEEPVTSHGVILEPRFSLHELSTGADTTWRNLPRYLSADGNHLFFSTEEELVAEDKNEVFDAYEYDLRTGRQRLLSSGRGETPSILANASADGRSVAILTKQQLVGRDVDSLRDLYMSRVDGGFAEPPPPPTPCVGDGCRGPIPQAPTDLSPSTPRFSGPGNPKPKHHKPRRHRKKKHSAKKHSTKKHSNKHKRGSAK